MAMIRIHMKRPKQRKGIYREGKLNEELSLLLTLPVVQRSKLLPFAQAAEKKHWSEIKNVLRECERCVYVLTKELPQGNHQTRMGQARMQLEMTLKKDSIVQIQRHLSSYTQVLQLSLTTVSLGSLWETQQSQDKIQMKIEKLTDELEEANKRWREPQDQENGEKGLDTDRTVKEMLAFRNIEAWRASAKGLADAVTLYGSEKQSSTDRGVDGSSWDGTDSVAIERVQRHAVPEDPIGVTDGGRMSHGDSGIEIDWDPEAEKTHLVSIDILKHQIEANKERVKTLVSQGSYIKAEDCHRKGMELRDKLGQMHNVSSSDKVDAEEIMADIYMGQKGARESTLRAKDILQRLIEHEVQRFKQHPQPIDNDRSRCWRLYYKLSAVYLALNIYDKAIDFASRAFEGWKGLKPMRWNQVRPAGILLARAYDSNQDFDQAQGIKNWIQGQDLKLGSAGIAYSDEKTEDGLLPNPTLPGLAESLRWCKEKGFDVGLPEFRFETPNQEGEIALHVAVQDNNLGMVERIVDHVATLETRDRNSSTALLLACATRNRRTVQALLHHGARVDVVDKSYNTPLHRLQSGAGGVETAKLLLDHEPGIGGSINIDQKNINMETALHLACQMGNEAMVSFLLEHNANANCPGPAGYTPLHAAISQRERLSIVEKLLQYGADTTLRDSKGRDALKVAKTARRRSPEIIKILEDHEEKRRLSSSRSLMSNLNLSLNVGRRGTVTSESSVLSDSFEGGNARDIKSPRSPQSKFRFSKKEKER